VAVRLCSNPRDLRLSRGRNGIAGDGRHPTNFSNAPENSMDASASTDPKSAAVNHGSRPKLNDMAQVVRPVIIPFSRALSCVGRRSLRCRISSLRTLNRMEFRKPHQRQRRSVAGLRSAERTAALTKQSRRLRNGAVTRHIVHVDRQLHMAALTTRFAPHPPRLAGALLCQRQCRRHGTAVARVPGSAQQGRLPQRLMGETGSIRRRLPRCLRFAALV
jgi:hypothetical protein